MSLLINADRKALALIDAASLPWVPSPEPGVARRMLERIGGEVAIATSVVRYDKASKFSSHVHAQGEEFLVLSGTFSDRSGDYPAGSYVRNPPGSSHAPHSEEGCVIFVKLRQMDASESQTVHSLPAHRCWLQTTAAGVEESSLYRNASQQVMLMRFAPGAVLPARETPHGEELFVVDGAIELLEPAASALRAWSWRRSAATPQPALRSAAGALLWVKRGHL